MSVPGAFSQEDLQDRAKAEAARLLEELKREVKADIRDVGTLRKHVAITVPEKVISGYYDHNYSELRSDAQVPGFRKGRAPKQLIRKRFSSDVRNNLKTSLIGQSFFAAMQNQKLEVLGDPLIEVKTDVAVKLMSFEEALEHVDLPESGDFSYQCEVEVKPEFTLPELTGIAVKRPQLTISDADVSGFIDRQRKIRGQYAPLQGAPASDVDDLIVANVTLKVEDQVIKSEDNVQLGLRPTRLDGVRLMDLAEQLKNVKPGDRASVSAEIPDDYERPDLRGKPCTFEFLVTELKRLTPVSVDDLIAAYGAESEDQLRQFIREDMEAERDRLVERAQKEQILDYLHKSTQLALPEMLSAKQTDRAVMRRVIELQQKGVPDSEIEKNIDELRTSASEDTARDLKLEFILEKVAQQMGLQVSHEELNSEIARIARMYDKRFDRVRDELQSRGLLMQLVEQIRQDKCLTKLLADATIEDVAQPAK